MSNKKLVNIISIFILCQPFYDAFVFFINDVLKLNFGITSLIRPLFAISLFLYLYFTDKNNKKLKNYFLIYVIIYGVYSILHLFNIREYFFATSAGTIKSEFRYLCNYGYYLLQMMNFILLFKNINKDEKNKILKSLVYAALSIAVLYFISILTGTSPKTYTYPSIKQGFKGWSISSHYIGHVLTYMLPVVIYIIFEKKLFKEYLGYIILVVTILPGIYFIGTKTPLFVQEFIIIFYTIITLLKDIFKNKKLNRTTIFLCLLSIILVSTFKLTYGYDNFINQSKTSESTKGNISDLIINVDYNQKLDIDSLVSSFEQYDTINNLDERLKVVLLDSKEITSKIFDNRDIQKIVNKGLYEYSTFEDKLFGYGHDTLPRFIWVETDGWTIFYCYGLVGFILTIVLPLLYVGISGLRCLIDYKNLTTAKMLLGASTLISIAIIFEVGYTMQFAQTVFYYIILLLISKEEFDYKEERSKKKYLFAINDLSTGGAEVGLVDVINELSKNESVDLVLLRKQGELLEKVNKNVNIYEILNNDYSKLKKRIYHVLYFMGGPFTKYVYSKTIKYDYDVEIAYIEGYPAVFIANSTNTKSIKIASIRVGLKNHKLKASKIPFGLWHLKNAYKKMDRIYTVSNETTKEFIEKYPFCNTKTTTIYTYFNVDNMKDKANEKMNFEFDKKCINFLAVGRFNEQKGYLRLIEAFDEVYKKHKNIRLHMLGKYDTEYGEKVLELIKEKKLQDVITTHGVIRNPYPYMKNCDCLISSSYYEGYPRVINEALSLGKICIGTNVTGTKEALLDGKMGILVDDSIKGIVDGMNKFIENKDIINKYKNEIEKFDGNKESYFKGLKSLENKRKKMIIYMPKLSIGGMEKALVNLINYTKINDNYELTLYLTYKGDVNYIDELPKNIKLVTACPGKWNIFGKFIAGVRLYSRYIYHLFNKYDISISYSYQHPILLNLTRFASKNNIVYIHSNIAQATSPKVLKNKLKKAKYEKFTKIICVSHNGMEALTKLINRKDNVYVINNPIDGEKIINKANEKINDFKFENDKIYFINISRHMEIYKKLMRIIDATYKLNNEGYKFDVLFVGDGDDDSLYVEKIRELNIKNIHLLGKKSNPYPYLKNSDAFVLSSAREGYPVVFLESMVLNTPIITTSVSDALTDVQNKFGIVVNNDDTSIYEGMKQFLDNGYVIKDKFNYVEFNNTIISDTYKVFESK